MYFLFTLFLHIFIRFLPVKQLRRTNHARKPFLIFINKYRTKAFSDINGITISALLMESSDSYCPSGKNLQRNSAKAGFGEVRDAAILRMAFSPSCGVEL